MSVVPVTMFPEELASLLCSARLSVMPAPIGQGHPPYGCPYQIQFQPYKEKMLTEAELSEAMAKPDTRENGVQ